MLGKETLTTFSQRNTEPSLCQLHYKKSYRATFEDHMHLRPFNQYRQSGRTELNDIGNLIDAPWCIGGDFNEILFSTDRNRTSARHHRSNSFHEWISDFSLIDLPLPNLQHTWSNFRAEASCSRLDRIFVTKEWMDKLP